MTQASATKKNVQKTKRVHLAYSLLATLLVLFFGYLYFLGNTIIALADTKTQEHEAGLTMTRIAHLEHTYLTEQAKLSKEHAYELGFTDSQGTYFVYVNTPQNIALGIE